MEVTDVCALIGVNGADSKKFNARIDYDYIVTGKGQLRRWNTESEWAWVNGGDISSIPWGPNEPNNSGGEEDCFDFITGHGYNDNTCGRKSFSISCATGYSLVGTQCLSFNTEEKLNWQEASDKCQANGDNLAVVKDLTSLQQHLGEHYGGAGQAFFWLGGRKSQAQEPAVIVFTHTQCGNSLLTRGNSHNLAYRHTDITCFSEDGAC
ncbi:unnamed protein product, partial [Meganyctiphanes norvegica]